MPAGPLIRIGSRGSDLALWQARRVSDRIAALGLESEIITIRTSGDEGSMPAGQSGSVKGMFTREIERALNNGTIDVAVHSLKDLESSEPEGLVIAAFPEREDPRDVLVSPHGPLDRLPEGARIGTSSVRRRAQLMRHRPDIVVVELRGNVPTRVRRVKERKVDAVVVAHAGVRRLGLQDDVHPIPVELMTPAAGQGALAVQCRAGDDLEQQLAQLDDAHVRFQVSAERAALNALGGDCNVPVGAICTVQEGDASLYVRVLSPDGRQMLDVVEHVDTRQPEAAGHRAATSLLERGASNLINSCM